MTQITQAKMLKVTDEVKAVAITEKVSIEYLQKMISCGQIVILHNRNHNLKNFCGIGTGLRTKVNANIGTSPDIVNIEEEIKKAQISIDSGADTVMDLSIGGDISQIRKEIIKKLDVPIGTVPIYQAAIEAVKAKGSIMAMTPESILKVIEEQAIDGVDFMTIHAGVTQETIQRLIGSNRLMDIVSRGGSFLTEWMIYHKKENPLYEAFTEILKIAKEYDVVLSLGDGLRPGCIKDSTDSAQIQELIILAELTTIAWQHDVQIIIEGPGHLPLNQIEANVLLQKSLCRNAPFYVLGPLVCDITPGYDHITGAIGGAIAAMAGADFLCYVTPAEHLMLPTLENVKQGVIASRIAAHAADIAKGVPNAMDWDIKMANARKALDWQSQIELSIDPELTSSCHLSKSQTCTMCGEYCAIKISNESLMR